MSRDDDMPRDSDVPKRQGDILGLGGSEVPKTADDPSAATGLTRRRTIARAAWTWMSPPEPGICRAARVRPASTWAAAEAGPISSSALR